jgi:hypothetical protein
MQTVCDAASYAAKDASGQMDIVDDVELIISVGHR